MKRSNEPRLPMATVLPRMDRLAIETNSVFAVLLGRAEAALNSDEAADFHDDVIDALAIFLRDRAFQADPTAFLEDLHKVQRKTRKFLAELASISSPLTRAISDKECDTLRREGGNIDPLMGRISSDLSLLLNYVDELAKEEGVRGPVVDRPSFNLVKALAQVYRDATGKRPTYGNGAYDKGKPATDFARLVDGVMDALNKAITSGDEAIQQIGTVSLSHPEAVVRLVCSGAKSAE